MKIISRASQLSKNKNKNEKNGMEKMLTSFVAIAVPFFGGVGLTSCLAWKPGFPKQQAFNLISN